jgi:hypothetical protein
MLPAITGDTHRGNEENSSGQTDLFNIWTTGAMDKTSAQPQVKLSLLRSFALKINAKEKIFPNRAHICKWLRKLRNRFRKDGNRFLGSLKGLQIRTQVKKLNILQFAHTRIIPTMPVQSRTF